MKNLLKFGLAMLLVSVLALSVGAAEWITKDVTDKLDEGNEPLVIVVACNAEAFQLC